MKNKLFLLFGNIINFFAQISMLKRVVKQSVFNISKKAYNYYVIITYFIIYFIIFR